MKLNKFATRFLLGACIVAVAPLAAANAQVSRSVTQATFSADQLDNLVAPIALYPDPILAQVLVAATFPDQLEYAVKYVRANGTRGIDDQPWDVSVKAVAHYPPVLNLLADRPEWATALGQAYASQSSDVMESVQRLREMAKAQGNLQSTSQQTVIDQDQNIRIVPAQPQVIYVPTYDPEIIYYRPVFGLGMYAGYWSFGVGFPIGAWLSYDCDWYGRRVYYDGWLGGGWRVAAYPFIAFNTMYISPRYRNVYVDRDVMNRGVNYEGFGRYNTVHRTVTWNNRNDRGRDGRANSNPPRGGDNRSQGWNDNRNQGANDPRDQGRRDPRGQGRTDPRTTGTVTIERPGTYDSRGYRNAPVNMPPVIVDRKAAPRSRDNPPSAESRTNQPPPPTRYSAPPQTRYSAPPPTRNSAPPQTRNSAPPQTRNSAPPQTRNSAPPPPRNSAPPSSRGSSKDRDRRG